jgi:hypothetical protein
MKLLKPLSIVFFVGYSTLAFAQKQVSLLLAEYDENTSVNQLQYLINYVFVDGKMVAREQIVAAPIQKEKGGKKESLRSLC